MTDRRLSCGASRGGNSSAAASVVSAHITYTRETAAAAVPVPVRLNNWRCLAGAGVWAALCHADVLNVVEVGWCPVTDEFLMESAPIFELLTIL